MKQYFDKFDSPPKDEDGRECNGFCPTCLMTEVEARQKDCARRICLA
jgi:hypothetical protein